VLTIVFGAGASYDSDPLRTPPPGYQERPPLSNELFDLRDRFTSVIARYRQLAAITNDIRRNVRSGQNLETVLAAMKETRSTYPIFPSQLMALRYYLRDVIDETSIEWSKQCSGATTYAEFANLVSAWSHETGNYANYITFNYDVLLEEALFNIGQTFLDLEDYIRPPGIGAPNVIRPHGSVRWCQIMRSGTPLNSNSAPIDIINNASHLTATEVILLEKPDEKYFESLGEYRTVVPAIALPVDNKQEFVCPERHVNTMREIIQQTKVLLIIGWKGTDPHFVDELKAMIMPGTSLFVCNGSEIQSASTVESLGLKQTHSYATEFGFSSLTESDYFQEILKKAKYAT